MTIKSTLLPLSLFCMTQVMADSGITQVPEGKITDYHCVHPDITPSAGPRVIDGINMFISGDYLYWTARESNLVYASTGFTNNPSASVNSGVAKTPSFKYKSGFKAALGFNFGHDAWDSEFSYTWFQSNDNTSSMTASYADGLTPTFEPVIGLDIADYFSAASTLWSLHFNSLDWELGRNCYISRYLSLRPFVGLKGTWQKQTFNNSYEGTISDLPFNYYNNNSSSYWGVGIRTGMNTSWHLSESWSFFGDLALAGLWSSFDTHRTDTYNVAGNSSVRPVSEKNTTNAVVPVLELSLGIRKDIWLFKDRLHIGAQAGWEEQIWWNIYRDGNLFLQGLTAKLRFDF